MGRRVAVIGAGNTAIDAATAAHRLGAEEVHMLFIAAAKRKCRRSSMNTKSPSWMAFEFHWWT